MPDSGGRSDADVVNDHRSNASREAERDHALTFDRSGSGWRRRMKNDVETRESTAPEPTTIDKIKNQFFLYLVVYMFTYTFLLFIG